MARTNKPQKSGGRKHQWGLEDAWKDLTTWRLRHKLLVAFALVLGGYLLFRQVEMRIQKAEFKRAEQSMRTEDSGAIASVGQPDSYYFHVGCYYMSRVFGRGPRECYITSNLTYAQQSPEDATTLMNKFIAFYDKTRNSSVNSSHDSSDAFNNLDNVQTRSQQIRERLDGCRLDYSYYLAEQSGVGAKPKDFVVTKHCQGEAFAEYYPVTD